MMRKISTCKLTPTLSILSVAVIVLINFAIAHASSIDLPAPKSIASHNTTLFEIFRSSPFLVLFAILAIGIGLGKFEFFGVSLGASGVIFASLLAGHFGFNIPDVGKLGLVLFIYCVGLSAGPSFFATFKAQGRTLAKLTFLTLCASGAAAVACKVLFKLPTELVAGLYAGALTSTPGLAAATEALTADEQKLIAVGYGLAYPFGIIGVILFVQFVPRLFKLQPDNLKSTSEDEIVRILIEVKNPQLFGQKVVGKASKPVAQAKFHISRVKVGDRLSPITHAITYEQDMVVMAVGRKSCIPELELYLGQVIDDVVLDQSVNDNERAKFVLTSKEYVGKSLAQLEVFSRWGIIVTRVTRLDKTFVPSPDTLLESGDTLTCVGNADQLQRFANLIGHKAKAIHETDILSLLIGILTGLFLGMIPIALPGFNPITLGSTGGCLLAAIILGHFGRIGKVVNRVPIAARIVMQELGLLLFLAQAGIAAGASFLEVIREYGEFVFFAGAIITLAPLVVGYALGGYLFKLTEFQTLGALCGSMTSTPALGTLTSKTDSEVPVTSYASSYPLAMVLVIVIVNTLISLFSS